MLREWFAFRVYYTIVVRLSRENSIVIYSRTSVLGYCYMVRLSLERDGSDELDNETARDNMPLLFRVSILLISPVSN